MSVASRSAMLRRYIATTCIWLALVGCRSESAKPAKTTPAPPKFEPPADMPAGDTYAPHPSGSLTFTKDIAPIVFQKCATCHHPGDVAPFPLLSYADVHKRAQQIVEVIRSYVMPPWSPIRGYCEFEKDRSLNANEIGMISQWVDEGATEGEGTQLPPLPEFTKGWKFGQPDLVVSMPEPFVVPADSATDIYRKFVIRVPIEETKYVRAFDFDPGNQSVVHHMRLRVDRTKMSRYQDQQDPQSGFDGIMFSGDVEPDGFFLVWTPGYESVPKHADVAWTLPKGADLVLELHLHPTGKEEVVQSSIALYFQPEPPRQHMHMLQLSCETIDIPAGATGVAYEDRYRLPVDTTVLAAMPHAHFLATEFRSWAELPDGQKIWLMRIADWDFNWQREYTYAKPISLPKGSVLCMQVTFDNSSDNPRNPFSPPRRVVIGRDTFNEMAQVFFQVIATNPKDGELLRTDFSRKDFDNNLQRERFRVDRGLGTTEIHFNLACLYGMKGDFQQAMHHYHESIRLKPDNVFAVNNLGSLYLKLGRPQDAIQQFTRALQIDPQDTRVSYNLGLIYLDQRQNEQAGVQFESAVRINPDFADAWEKLGIVALRLNDLPLAVSHLKRSIQANPDLESAKATLKLVQSRQNGHH